MPPNHRAHAEWTPSRFINWASKIGESTARLIERVLASRAYQEQTFRSCMGIIQLSRNYEPERVEAAARRALKYNACSYQAMKTFLANGLDQQQDTPENSVQMSLPLHQNNIRGPEYSKQ